MKKAGHFEVGKGPRIFFYAIFELDKSKFWCQWLLEEPKPFSMSTTCFYTKLRDLEARRFPLFRDKTLRMRVSGAKIISERMSPWFFWNLANVVFHEGLYRQERIDDLNADFDERGIQYGLENRLEVFADQLTNTFSQQLLAYQNARRSIEIWIIGAIITIVLGVLRFFK